MVIILKTLLGLMAGFFSLYYFKDVFRNRKPFSAKPYSGLSGIGLFTNFLDTLGIGSFAQQTALFKFFKLVDDRIIPGTMNVGNTIPTVAQAFIFMTAVEIDPVTLVSVAAAASLGALLGAGVVARLRRNRIQLGMGIGLLLVGLVILAGLIELLPLGGEADGLSGWKLLLIIVMSFIFGALQTIGIGFYAPCMAMVYALGMHPLTAFPLMMTSTALLMLAGSSRFIKENAYDRKTAIALTIAGTAGVFLAAFVVKSLPLIVLKWIVCVVVFYTSVVMFKSAGIRNK
ncbi:MAG: permease [Odoribacter sp.]|nr:permease [Odoribacter sp.]